MTLAPPRVLYLLGLLLPGVAPAAAPGADYARQWTLDTGAGAAAGAYRVVLDEAVYRTADDRQLRDVAVFNAQGGQVAASVLSAAQPLVQAPRRVELPWFALPGEGGSPGGDLRLVAERDDEGRIRRVEAGVDTRPGSSAAGQWLVDASALRAPARALVLQWRVPGQPLQAAYRVEGSDDLRSWHILNGSTTLLDLERGGERLVQNRIALDGQARYLRLQPLRAGPVPVLVTVSAELPPLPLQPSWRWLELQGQPRSEGGRAGFEFRLPGRFPVERADVVLPGNSAVQWTLLSREEDSATWTWRAGPWMAYQVGEEGRSEPRALPARVRDRHWRLVPASPVGDAAPVLRLGYQPEVVVFLAQGEPPYALAAGSARARRDEAPIRPLLDALRARRGVGWEPAPATLADTPRELAGERALQPVREYDWKSWLLWALLVGGALVVALLGLSLLRRPPAES